MHDFPPTDVVRTVYAASGPGVQADTTLPGSQAMAFGHIHQARITGLPVQYDQIAGPEVLEPGVRVTFAMHPQTLDKRPVAVQFDSQRFTEDQARAWLAARNIRDYTFLPDERDQTPVTQGNPRAEGEKQPEGFSDLDSFYAATIPDEIDGTRASGVAPGDVVRTAGPHSYSSTQVNLRDPLRAKCLRLAAMIASEDLADDGREDEPHVTVLYGLETEDPEDVQKILAECPAARFTLTNVSVFVVQDKESQRGGAESYDVVKVDVDSQDLVELHDRLAKLPHVDTHPEYHPHVTLAYVKPGMGQKYAGMADFDLDQSGLADAVVFSNRAGEKTAIPLHS